ncbi:hypothetical protein HDV01_002701 [Terramyces sp. JEL0728]|nr:hypothetical protein HDV01_002701 [Terramyces sp. JEL0728]
MATWDNLPPELIDMIFKQKKKNFFNEKAKQLESNLKFFSCDSQGLAFLKIKQGYFNVVTYHNIRIFKLFLRKPNDMHLPSDIQCLHLLTNLEHFHVKTQVPLINMLKKNNRLNRFMENPDETYENFIETFEEPKIKILDDLEKEQKRTIERYDKKIANDVLVILDDCVSFKKFINSYGFENIPKTIRQNASGICLFFNGNEKDVKLIYEENSCKLNFKEFLEILNQKTNILLVAFKLLTEEHDGKSLADALIEVLEDFEIADRLLGVTADNASNNSTMMAHLEQYYKANYLFSIQLQGYVKDYTNQQNRSSEELEVVSIDCNNGLELREKVWEAFEPKLVNGAKLVDGVFRIDENRPTSTEMDNYIYMRRHRRSTPFGTNIPPSTLQSLQNSAEPVEVHILKYSNVLKLKDHWNSFRKECLDPPLTDRSGAISNELVHEYVDRLRTNHPELSGDYVNWARWILNNNPPDRWDTLTRDGPPPNLSNQFRDGVDTPADQAISLL